MTVPWTTTTWARLDERLDPEFEPDDDSFCISLTTTNRNADRINAAKLASLPGERTVFHADVQGDFGREHYPTATELALKEGAQVMMVNNDAEGALGQWQHRHDRVPEAASEERRMSCACGFGTRTSSSRSNGIPGSSFALPSRTGVS